MTILENLLNNLKENSMTQEEKAKAYDEVIERAKKVLLDCTSEEQKVVEYITPELKESEDERIRKWIIGVLSTYEHDKDLRNAAIAWLEKQAEHKKFRDSIQVGDKVTKNEDGVLVNLSQLKRVAKKDEKQSEEIIPLEEIILNVWELGNYWKELTKGVCNTEHGSQLDYIVKHWKEGEHYIKSFEKQDKQKPVVIPKFRVGDKVKKGYLTYTVEDIGEDSYKLQAYSKDGNKGSTVFLTIGYEKDYELVEQKSIDKVETKFHEGNFIIANDSSHIYQVMDVKRGIYIIKDLTDDVEYHIGIEEAHKSGRLWIIEDAEDGDYLTVNGRPFIYCCYDDYQGNYCCIDSNGEFRTSFNFGFNGKTILPATKEQRTLLFQKMYEAGYEWDAKNKELKNIETKGGEK